MSSFHVDSDVVVATAQSASATADRISSDTAALLAQLTGLSSSWSGSAALAFQDTLTQGRSTQQVVESSLASIHRALALAGNHYADVEAHNARMFLG